MLVLVMLLLLATARADEPLPADDAPAPPPSEEPAPQTFEELLEHAKSVYFGGRDEEALELFKDLQIRLQHEEPDWDLAATALIYVGEIQYRRGRHDLARAAFRTLLEKDSDYQISPYSHPIEVVGEFSTVRDQVKRAQGEIPEQEPPPLPSWGYLPLGIPQFKSKRPLLGIAFAGLQAGLGGASIGVYVNTHYLNVVFPRENGIQWLPSDHPRGWTAQETKANINRQRYQLQWPLVVASYVMYVSSVTEARGHWRRNFVAEPALSVFPTPEGGSQVVFSGRF